MKPYPTPKRMDTAAATRAALGRPAPSSVPTRTDAAMPKAKGPVTKVHPHKLSNTWDSGKEEGVKEERARY